MTHTRPADDVTTIVDENTRLRRRERELAALYSSARELAELRDSAAVLDRLVQRAHQMLGGDVTYLSEFHPDTGELRVRTTAGAVSPAFRRLRVPPGCGLAGAVVETRDAQWAEQYASYRTDRHDPGVDQAVADEGIVSLLGVPMVSGDDVLGVLFVATRTAHRFTQEEVALLSALADHASVVLQTAETLRNLRRSEDEAQRALAELREHLAERDRASAVHARLVQVILTGGGFAPVAEILADGLGRPVAIVDERGTVVGAAGLPLPAAMVDRDDQADRRVHEATAASHRTGHCVPVDQVPGTGTVMALAAGPRLFGAVLVGDGEQPLGAVDRRTVERAGQVGALLALQQEAGADAEQRVRTEVVTDLLHDVPERRADVERRARRLGVGIDELDTLLLFAVPGDRRTAAVRQLGALLGERALVGEHRGYVVAVHDAGAGAPAPDQLRARVARSIGGPVLAVVPPAARGALPAAFVTAERTARLLAALGAEDEVAATEDYVPYAAVLDVDARSLDGFLAHTIGPVRRYDAERGTDLLETLRTFVRVGASPTRTARELSFHTNTILQRLGRLDQLLGDGWRDGERLFRIGVAVRLDELRERLRPSGA